MLLPYEAEGQEKQVKIQSLSIVQVLSDLVLWVGNLTLEFPGDEVVQRQRAGAAGDDEKERTRPEGMVGP